MKNLLSLLTVTFISLPLYCQISSGTWYEIYNRNNLKVEISFDVSNNGCYNGSSTIYSYKFNGYLSSTTNYINWKLDYLGCDGNKYTHANGVLVGGYEIKNELGSGKLEDQIKEEFNDQIVNKKIVSSLYSKNIGSTRVSFDRVISQSSSNNKRLSSYDPWSNNSNSTKKTANDYYDSALELMKKEQYTAALKNVNIAISMNPNISYFYGTKGLVLFFKQNYSESIYSMNKAISIDSDVAEFYFVRGLSKKMTGKSFCNDFKKSCDLGYQNGCDGVNENCKKNKSSFNVSQFENSITYILDAKRPIGISYATLKSNKIGGYFDIAYGGEFPYTYNDVDNFGNHNSSAIDVIVSRGEIKTGDFYMSTGITTNIKNSFWFYGGFAFNYHKYAEYYDTYFNIFGNLSYYEPQWYRNSDRSGWSIIPQLGVYTKFNKIVLKSGFLIENGIRGQFGVGLLF